MCCDRPISDYEIQDAQVRMQQRQNNDYAYSGLKRRGKNLSTGLYDEKVTNESRLYS